MTDTGPDTPGNADDAVEEAKREVIEAMARSAEVYGLRPSFGHLYGILYFAPGPLSLDDLVERSGYAKSTVSTAMRALERFHMVYRRSLPGEGKRAFYEAERDLWYVVGQFLDGQVRRELAIMGRALESAEQSLDDGDVDDTVPERERIGALVDLADAGERLVERLTEESPESLVGAIDEADRSG